MKFKKAKKYKGQELSLLELDNLFSPHDNISLFGCGDGRDAIEMLIKDGESNFSYKENMLSNEPGYCVEFELINERPNSSDYSDSCNTIVKITNIWEH
jgi:hypothetical protein